MSTNSKFLTRESVHIRYGTIETKCETVRSQPIASQIKFPTTMGEISRDSLIVVSTGFTSVGCTRCPRNLCMCFLLLPGTWRYLKVRYFPMSLDFKISCHAQENSQFGFSSHLSPAGSDAGNLKFLSCRPWTATTPNEWKLCKLEKKKSSRLW